MCVHVSALLSAAPLEQSGVQCHFKKHFVSLCYFVQYILSIQLQCVFSDVVNAEFMWNLPHFTRMLIKHYGVVHININIYLRCNFCSLEL